MACNEELAELKTLEVVTRDPTKYLLVNLEDGTFFQGQDKEELVDEPMIRRKSALMWERPQDTETLLRALDVLFDAALDTVRRSK